VASLQGDWVGVATALSPATVGHFKFLFHLLFVGLGLIVQFFFSETKPIQQVSRFRLWESRFENPMIDVEKRLEPIRNFVCEAMVNVPAA
jgi:uncharacterized membrane protein